MPSLSALSALVATLGALATITSGLGGHLFRHANAAETMFQQLARASPAPAAADNQFGVLTVLRDIRKTAWGASNAPLRAEVDALLEADRADAAKCTVENQQWLIRQMLRYKQSQLGAYVDSARAKQRDFCLATFEQRLDARVEGQTDAARQADVIDEVEDLSRSLGESVNSEHELYKLDDVPLESLVRALRSYIEQNVDLQAGLSEAHALSEMDEANTMATVEIVNGFLMDACRQLTSAYGDFVWMLKLFAPQRPAGLGPVRHERLLWLTKVCRSLEFDSFGVKLYEHYHDSSRLPSRARKHVEKFANLLRDSDPFELVLNSKVAPGDAQQALETLASERHFRATTPEDAAQPAERERAELAASCADVRRALAQFLWLIDLGLVRVALDSRETVELLKPARVCELLPELFSQQKTRNDDELRHAIASH